MQVGRPMAAALVIALSLGACSSDGDAGEDRSDGGRSAGRTPVVIDTDVGADDVTAILYLLRHPDLEVRAITVSGTGLAHCDGGVRTVLGLLEIAQLPTIPTACGRETPLGGSNAFPEQWRAEADGAYGLDLPEPTGDADEAGAVALLTSTLRSAGTPVTLVTLGPLTNVAEALIADPALAEGLGQVVAMGGALLAGGNVEANPEAEWNLHADPRAADVLLRSGAPITLVPLDATNAVPVTAYFIEALATHHVTPEADTVLALLEGNPWMVEGGDYFWDPLAATVAAGAATVTFEERRVVVLEGSPDVDGELVMSSNGAEVRVAMDADPLAFETELINTLNGDEQVTTTRPEPDLALTITSSGCAGEVPTSLPAGRIDVRVDNPLTVGGGAILATTTGGRGIDELVAFVENIDPTTPDVEPPPWIEGEASADAPAGGTSLARWELAPGTHAIVCVVENGAVGIAGTFEVAG